MPGSSSWFLHLKWSWFQYCDVGNTKEYYLATTIHNLFIRLSVCLSVYRSAYLPACLPPNLLPTYLVVFLSVCHLISDRPSVCLCIKQLPLYLFNCLSREYFRSVWEQVYWFWVNRIWAPKLQGRKK